MIAALICGGVVGLGVLLFVRGYFPPRPSLADALAELSSLPQTMPEPVVTDGDEVGFAARAGAPIARLLRRVTRGDLLLPSVRRDLAVLERSPERQLAEKVALAIFGLLVVPVLAFVFTLEGAHLPIVLPVWGAVVLAALGFFLPDLSVRGDANGRRAEFRHGLSAYLDLVVIALAAGGGIETALSDAAEVGNGLAFVRLRRCLDEARLSRIAPATALRALGEELRVAELVELSSSLALAGSEGARVRSSIQAKAASMRVHELAATETEAQAATERMTLPMALLLVGFFLLIGFPAFVRVAHGL